METVCEARIENAKCPRFDGAARDKNGEKGLDRDFFEGNSLFSPKDNTMHDVPSHDAPRKIF